MVSTMTRLLGRSGIAVSAMGLGCWAIGGPCWRGENAVGWGDVDDAESIRAIHAAIDRGITFFDTSNVYGTGHSERVLGQALAAGKRSQVVIATKFGNVFDETTRQITGANVTPDHIRQSCAASLQRLNTDTIDLYQLHLGDYDPVAAVEVRQTLEELVASGKIRQYGWSTDSIERARVFAAGPHCCAVQHQMNVLDDAPAMIAVCEELNLASVNRGPLAMGLLTGKYGAELRLADNDVRGGNSPGWMKYFQQGHANSEWLKKVESLRDILTSGGRTLAQGSLAWLWARSEKTIPIPGFRTVKQVEENSGAMSHGPLQPAQMREIDRLLER
jgi:aryl-alcohol dehydrogenase-like predicted oxidoreductase